jgi:hypothetical protein
LRRAAAKSGMGWSRYPLGNGLTDTSGPAAALEASPGIEPGCKDLQSSA